MYAVIFEVEPEPDRLQDYLDIAAHLRPELEKIDGFISIERFQSLTQDGKILSLSFGAAANAPEIEAGIGSVTPRRCAAPCRALPGRETSVRSGS
jgi:hypothetical protein